MKIPLPIYYTTTTVALFTILAAIALVNGKGCWIYGRKAKGNPEAVWFAVLQRVVNSISANGMNHGGDFVLSINTLQSFNPTSCPFNEGASLCD